MHFEKFWWVPIILELIVLHHTAIKLSKSINHTINIVMHCLRPISFQFQTYEQHIVSILKFAILYAYIFMFVSISNLTLVFGLVVVARFIRDAMAVGILPHTWMITPMAGPSLPTINNILDWEICRRPCSLPLDVNAIYIKYHRQHFIESAIRRV